MIFQIGTVMPKTTEPRQYIHMRIHTCAHVCAHTHTHAHTHTQTHGVASEKASKTSRAPRWVGGHGSASAQSTTIRIETLLNSLNCIRFRIACMEFLFEIHKMTTATNAAAQTELFKKMCCFYANWTLDCLSNTHLREMGVFGWPVSENLDLIYDDG